MKPQSLLELETYDAESKSLNAIIETPAGSRNKFKYMAQSHLFALHKVLPAGATFPYDFGFIPSTLGEDGDPLDILVLLNEPVYPGVLIPVRLIGAIQAIQTAEGKSLRNDRFIGVAEVCQNFQGIKELKDLDASVITQLEHFFISYNQAEGKTFKPIGQLNSHQAEKLLEEGRKRFRH